MRSLLFAVSLLLVSAAWADDGTLALSVAYKGGDQYTFEKKDYGSYDDLLRAIRRKYGQQHITSIEVHMGTVYTVNDALKVCRLKHDTGAMISMHFEVDGQKNQLFCN